ncbi:hypothetical protein CDD80_3786 [Ophiocordyceps camponoti-rufipedis]|uniref:Uncharacterized protein n=1 Tax=Ophiocordyceps camponoti-rufipedis TaxID=2004952 RepID=A0A2C5ZIV5_9HYPO|nr:hypothetical protein CDD80_3786 [Ophiocordyceps camponoti-rufipedis]
MGQPLGGVSSALLLALYLTLILWTTPCMAAPQLSSPSPMFRDNLRKSASTGSIGSKMLKDIGRERTWHSFTPAQLGKSRKTHPVDGGHSSLSPMDRRVRPGLPEKSNRKPASREKPHKQNPGFTESSTESLASSKMAWMKEKQAFERPAKLMGGQFSTPRKKEVGGMSKPEKQHSDVMRPVKKVQDAAAALPVKKTQLRNLPGWLRAALRGVGMYEGGGLKVKSKNGGKGGKMNGIAQKSAIRPDQAKDAKTRPQQAKDAETGPRQAAKMDHPPAGAKNLGTANDSPQRIEKSAIAAERNRLFPKENTQFQSDAGDVYWTVKRHGQPLSEAEFRSKESLGKGSESLWRGRGEKFHPIQPSREVQPGPGMQAEKTNSRTAAGARFEQFGKPLTQEDREFLKPKTGKKRTSHPTLRQLDKARSYVSVDLANVNHAAAVKDQPSFTKKVGRFFRMGKDKD